MDCYLLPPARHRPKTIIDWRSELCRFLQLSHEPSDEDILEALEETEEKLRDAERLKSQFSADPGPSRYQVVYTIGCRLAPAKDHETLYLDTPWPVDSGPYHSHLRGSRAITNLELYLERNQNVSFLVYREYSCCYQTIKWQENSDSQQHDAEELSEFFHREYIDPISEDLREALTELSDLALYDIPHPRFDGKKLGRVSHPYLWWFHRRKEIEEAKTEMVADLQKHIDVFQAYLEDRLQTQWNTVDDLLSRGKITVELLRYLFASTQDMAHITVMNRG